MKISIDHVTNSSSESFGTAVTDSIVSIVLGIPFIASTLGLTGAGTGSAGSASSDTGGVNADLSAPYPSTDPDDVPGTLIQNNPDGSTTKMLPDGTVGTKMPDGTVYVAGADGTTGIITPDGHEKYTAPDGTITEVYTDGTTRVTTPDGGMALQRPDGSFELKEPGKATTQICAPDGSILGVRDANGGEIYQDKSGNLTGKAVLDDGLELEVAGNTSGDVSLTNPNGTEVIIDKAGELKSGKIVSEDGYASITADGQVQGEFTDPATGVKTEIVSTEDGSLTIKDSQSSDGSADQITNHPDGSATWVHQDPNGEATTVEVMKDGQYEIHGPNGEQETLVVNPDGSATLTQIGPDGQPTTMVAGTDGTVHITPSEGGHIAIGPDGSVTLTSSAGESKTYTAAEIKDLNLNLPGGEQL